MENATWSNGPASSIKQSKVRRKEKSFSSPLGRRQGAGMGVWEHFNTVAPNGLTRGACGLSLAIKDLI